LDRPFCVRVNAFGNLCTSASYAAGIPSGAKQAAEKGLFEGGFRGRALQGLNPDVDLIGFIGTAEAVP